MLSNLNTHDRIQLIDGNFGGRQNLQVLRKCTEKNWMLIKKICRQDSG